PQTFLAVAPHQIGLRGALQIGDDAETVLRQLRRADRANAVNEADGLWRQEGSRFGAAEHGEAARLVEIGGDLGEELVAGQPDRDGDPALALYLAGEAGQRLGWDHAVQTLGAGEIEKRLVDGQRLDQRRELLHRLAHRAPHARIFAHVRPHHDGVGAAAQGFEHRHRRSHAVGPRHIAGGGDDAALAAADNHRFIGNRRVIAFLDGGVEGVAIDMRDGERPDLAVAQQARRATARAALRGVRYISQAVAAEPAHGSSRSQSALPSAARARTTCSGLSSAAAAKPTSSASSATMWSRTPARNPGVRAAARIWSGPMPVRLKKPPSRSASAAI